VERIEKIWHATYERKIGGPRARTKGRTPIQITVIMELTTPCATNTPEITLMFRQLNFSGRKTTGHTCNRGESTGRAISRINNQLSTPRGGSISTLFKMVGHDPMVRLPEFQREASEDLDKHLFIYENIQEAKKIIDEDKKLMQIDITLRDLTL
jgi:hypothetical protein